MAPSHKCLGAGSTVPRVKLGLSSAGGPDGRVVGGPDGRVDRARAELNGNPVSREKKYDAITSHSMYPKVGYF